MVLRVKQLTREEGRNLAETSALVARAEDLIVLRVTGKDRLSWLSGLVTQEVGKLAAGDSTYAFLCEKKGKIVCDMHLFVRPDAIFLVVPAAAREAVTATLDHHLIMEDVEIAADEAAVFRVYGPRAEAIAKGLGGAVWAGAAFRLPIAHVLAEGSIDTFAERLADVVRENDAGIAPPGLEDELRTVLGVPRFGKDFGPSHYPQETALHGLGVSFSKGCYLGQEVLYMLEHRGHAKRHVVRLTSDAELVVGSPLLDGAAEVGTVSSVARDEATWTAVAMVKSAAAKDGHELLAGGARCVVHPIT